LTHGFKSNPAVTRCEQNPLLTREDVPYHASLVFNAGITKFKGKYVMAFRNDYDEVEQPRKLVGTNIGLALSEDGIKWQVEPQPCFCMESDEISRAYDPRLTVIEGRMYMCFAVDTRHGIRGGVAVSDDLEHWEVLSMSAPDNRNMVLFPEKVSGKFCRLERPFPVYGRGGPENFDMWFSDSPDCAYWGNTNLVLGSEQVSYANCKIGPAAPPVKTDRGWLTTIHAVWKHDASAEFPSWHSGWRKEYMCGVALLDLEAPWKVLGMSREPLLVPEKNYELEGYRGSVIFPGGMILEDDGEVKIYYGAADTVECLATANIDDLLALCEPI
jgi:beta-1,4-mannooligosaccharide/beta-1,4-mannosyl-N-acetylglucosamine phosphorylase